MTYALLHLFGPESYGGKGNLRLKAEEQARLTGRSYEEIAVEVRSPPLFSIHYLICAQLVFQPAGTLVHLPGIPPMYDYEHIPQEVSIYLWNALNNDYNNDDELLAH